VYLDFLSKCYVAAYALELYRRTKLLDRNADICFLTAVSNFSEYRQVYPDITEEIEKDKDSCVIDKPADTEKLMKKIDKVLGRRIKKKVTLPKHDQRI
jgi:hypothetical protein